MNKIWCLFSVDNAYDQPNNNLVAWWAEKPSLETLAETLARKFPGVDDEETLFVVKVWQGIATPDHFSTRFRLEEVKEGKIS